RSSSHLVTITEPSTPPGAPSPTRRLPDPGRISRAFGRERTQRRLPPPDRLRGWALAPPALAPDPAALVPVAFAAVAFPAAGFAPTRGADDAARASTRVCTSSSGSSACVPALARTLPPLASPPLASPSADFANAARLASTRCACSL